MLWIPNIIWPVIQQQLRKRIVLKLFFSAFRRVLWDRKNIGMVHIGLDLVRINANDNCIMK